ncbi:MAG: PAS domain S-box protein [Candidatus Saccharibacteria bacterium]|nr:PAS domain S-box protein [Rhodoferax sp.]
MAITSDHTIDLDLLDLNARQSAAMNKRAMRWLVGMLVLVGVSIALLAVFLRDVEMQEEDRRRTADAQWLDQTLRFHFRRLEGDLSVMALLAQRPAPEQAPELRPGALWQISGVMRYHGWLAADRYGKPASWPTALQEAAAQDSTGSAGGALLTMLETARGLQRAAYAGPLPGGAKSPQHTLWLAVPLVEQGRFLGAYIAAVQVDKALAQAIPSWFLQNHRLSVAPPATAHDAQSATYEAPITLPGAQWKISVQSLNDPPATAPRTFFGVALVCLAGMLVALYFLWRDAARQRTTESKLQTQIALRTAMERSVTLGLRAWDLQGRLLYVNKAFCRMVGWQADELMAAASGDSPGPWTRPVIQSAEYPQLGQELQLSHRDGHALEVLAHGAPLTLGNGAVIGWMGSTLDITERKQMERLAALQHEKMEASGRLIAMGEVASTLAHELNQPLGALSSFATGLLNHLQQQRISLNEVVPVVERMERLADKAGRVIKRVNAFARRQEIQRQGLACLSFVTRVAQSVNLPATIHLELHLPTTAPDVPADALLLEHALVNVVLNASEWAPLGSTTPACVRVSVLAEPERLGLRVEDSGPGVPPEQLAHIFDAFTSGKPGGMGMGLSICRSIVEAHHGRMEVDRSASLGGAQFTLWLPLSP